MSRSPLLSGIALLLLAAGMWSPPCRADASSQGYPAGAEHAEPRETVLFPPGEIFPPPLASPKEPRTHMTWQRTDLKVGWFNVGSVGFGERFGFVRWPGGSEKEAWQVGGSAAVFAQFNLDAPSMDLVNADYIVGFPLSYRNGDWSGRFRLYHQSSHLGDEFLLQPQPVGPVERINLSFETTELYLSREWRWLRLYAGPAYIVHTDTPLERWTVQGGIDYRGDPVGRGTLRPVAGVFLHSWQETGWDVDVSVKAGVQVQSPYSPNRSIQFLAEYFDGHLPYGQFYNLNARYFGFGVGFVF